MDPNLGFQLECKLLSVSRSMGRSRIAQAFIAFTVPLFCLGLACLIWQLRDFAAIILIVLLVDYGIKIAWRMIPIHPGTRARWSREQQIAKHYPAYHYRSYFFIGIAWLSAKLYIRGFDTPFTLLDFIVPIAFIIIGLGSYIACYRYIRLPENRNTIAS